MTSTLVGARQPANEPARSCVMPPPHLGGMARDVVVGIEELSQNIPQLLGIDDAVAFK
jgi:hypothetical protein